MRKYVLDFIFNERTGESRIVIDFVDESLSNLEINDAIRSGELRENAIDMARRVFGPEIAEKVKAGKIGIVCLDHHPEETKEIPLIPIASENKQKQGIDQ